MDAIVRQDGARPVIRLDGLTKTFGSHVAAHHVNLEIFEGELVTLLGPSGSGKSTTLMMVAGHITPDSGRIYVKERDITRQPPYRRRIGMVFQQYAIFPHMTVSENIAFPLRMQGMRKAEIAPTVASAIELVQLRGLGDRYANQLSGGQLQRVALARALVFGPSILLMDEPLSALDKQLRESMQLEIRRLQQQLAIPTLYVTHDQNEALILSDRIAVFNNGRIVQIGTPTELYERPQSEFVAEFIGASNLLHGVVSTYGGGICRIVTDQGIPVCAYSDKALRPGQAVTVSVRPEAIEISRESADGDTNRALGRIESILFAGNSRRVSVRVSDSLSLSVEERNNGAYENVAVGQSVAISWRWAKTNVMTKQEAEKYDQEYLEQPAEVP
ncbi:MAG: ABC transporter ATP-binding protein [Dongiaceae bacterium]